MKSDITINASKNTGVKHRVNNACQQVLVLSKQLQVRQRNSFAPLNS